MNDFLVFMNRIQRKMKLWMFLRTYEQLVLGTSRDNYLLSHSQSGPAKIAKVCRPLVAIFIISAHRQIPHPHQSFTFQNEWFSVCFLSLWLLIRLNITLTVCLYKTWMGMLMFLSNGISENLLRIGQKQISNATTSALDRKRCVLWGHFSKHRGLIFKWVKDPAGVGYLGIRFIPSPCSADCSSTGDTVNVPCSTLFIFVCKAWQGDHGHF